jgi:DNA-binding CsgD family transcriptional regulator
MKHPATVPADTPLSKELCEVALSATDIAGYRRRALELLSIHIEFDAALFHELSPRVPLARAGIIGLALEAIAKHTSGWDETALRLQPLLETALHQCGVATDVEAFPARTKSRKEWERRVAKPLSIRSVLAGHLCHRDRVMSALLLMRRQAAFTLSERLWMTELLPSLTLGDAYWQQAEPQGYAGLLAEPVCRDQRLTERQRQVVEGVAVGRTNQQIAAALGVSPHTVRNLLAEVSKRLGAGNRADVVRLSVLSAK